MPFRLRNLMLDRVDLVPAGANPGAEIMLFKSAKEDDVPQSKRKVAKKPVKKDDTRSRKKARGDEEEDEEEDDARVNKAGEDEDDEEADEEADGVEEDEESDEEETPRRKKKAAPKKATKKKVAKKKAADEDVEEDEDEDEDEDTDVTKSEDDDDEGDEDGEDEEVEEVPASVMKSLPESVRKSIERNQRVAKQARKDAKEAMRLATIEKNRRETTEYIQKAKTDVPNLPGTAEEKGEVLQALHSGQPIEKGLVKRIMKMFKAADAAMHTLLMSETGRRQARVDSDDAISQLRELGEEIRKKDAKLTKEQAFEKACDQNPDLFRQYLVEKRQTRREASAH